MNGFDWELIIKTAMRHNLDVRVSPATLAVIKQFAVPERRLGFGAIANLADPQLFTKTDVPDDRVYLIDRRTHHTIRTFLATEGEHHDDNR